MHYLAGQEVLGGTHKIHLIEYDERNASYKIYLEKEQEVFLWKQFNANMPISIEFNMNF